MTKTLATAVTVNVVADDGSVSTHSYAAGETPFAAHAKLITNAAAFDADEWAKDSLAPGSVTSAAPVVAAVDGGPPKGGAGSGLDEWTAFAVSIGVDVPDDATRDDVIAAVEAHQS